MTDHPEKLRRRRRALGLTIYDLADRLGADASTISKWESGDREPKLADLQRWGAALGLAVDVVVRADGSPSMIDDSMLSDAQRALLRATLDCVHRLPDEGAASIASTIRLLGAPKS